MDHPRRPKRLSRTALRVVAPLAWLVCVAAWLMIVAWDVETVLVTGPMILCLGVVVLIPGVRLRHGAAIILGLAHVAVVVLFVGLVNVLSWGPGQATLPFSVMGLLHVLISGGLTVHVLRTIPQMWDSNYCQTCGYPRQGSTSERCPECGGYWEITKAAEDTKPGRCEGRIVARSSANVGENDAATID